MQSSQGGSTEGREVRTGEGILRKGLGTPRDSGFIPESLSPFLATTARRSQPQETRGVSSDRGTGKKVREQNPALWPAAASASSLPAPPTRSAGEGGSRKSRSPRAPATI